MLIFCVFLNDDIADIEKPDGVCSPSFVVDEFSGLFVCPSIFYILLYEIHVCFLLQKNEVNSGNKSRGDI